MQTETGIRRFGERAEEHGADGHTAHHRGNFRLLSRHLDRKTPWRLVKKYCEAAGIDPSRLGSRGIGIHSLRKTAINDAIRNGATMHEVREFAGEDAKVAARRIQIRVTGSAKRLFQKPGEVPVFQGFSRPGPIFETVSKPPN